MRGHYVVTDAAAILWHLLHRGLINPWHVGMGDKVVQEEVHITHVKADIVENRTCCEVSLRPTDISTAEAEVNARKPPLEVAEHLLHLSPNFAERIVVAFLCWGVGPKERGQ